MTTLNQKIKVPVSEFANKYGELMQVLKGLSPAAGIVLGHLATTLGKSEKRLGKDVQESIAEKTKLNPNTVRIMILQLAEKGILMRNEKYKTLFKLNPQYQFGNKSKSFKYVLTVCTEKEE